MSAAVHIPEADRHRGRALLKKMQDDPLFRDQMSGKDKIEAQLERLRQQKENQPPGSKPDDWAALRSHFRADADLNVEHLDLLNEAERDLMLAAFERGRQNGISVDVQAMLHGKTGVVGVTPELLQAAVEAGAAEGITIKNAEDSPNERACADHFVGQEGKHWQHDRNLGKWRHFDGDRWREHDPEAHALLRKLAPELKRNAQQKGALAQAASVLTRREWNDNPALAVPGGWVDLETGEHHDQPRPELYSTRCAAVAPKHGKPTLWLDTLAQCLAGDDCDALTAYLQRWFGYCLTMDMREQVFSLWIGGGANGKSTIAGTVSDILGSYSQGMARQAVIRGTHEPHAAIIAKLEGARLAYCADLEGGLLDGSRIKQITGGDPVSAQFMRQDWFDFQPVCKLLLLSNKLPRLAGVDKAISRRIHLVEWRQDFDDNPDMSLREKLKDEWPLILSWMIEGAVKWRKQGLNPPPCVAAATKSYLDDEDTLGQWFVESVQECSGHSQPAAALVKNCQAWHERNGFAKPSAQAVGRWLTAQGYEPAQERIEGRNQKVRRGLILQADSTMNRAEERYV